MGGLCLIEARLSDGVRLRQILSCRWQPYYYCANQFLGIHSSVPNSSRELGGEPVHGNDTPTLLEEFEIDYCSDSWSDVRSQKVSRESSQVLKRVSAYQCSHEVIRKRDAVSGRKKIEFSPRTASSLSVERIDSLCDSDEEGLEFEQSRASVMSFSEQSTSSAYGHVEEEEGWGVRECCSESTMVGKMHVSCHVHTEFEGAGRQSDDSMVTEFVLYDTLQPRKSSDELHPELETAAIVMQVPLEKRESLKFKRGDEKLLDRLRLGGTEEGVFDISSSGKMLVVILPGGNHSFPSNGSCGPSPLLDRWRLGEALKVYTEEEIKTMLHEITEEGKSEMKKMEQAVPSFFLSTPVARV